MNYKILIPGKLYTIQPKSLLFIMGSTIFDLLQPLKALPESYTEKRFLELSIHEKQLVDTFNILFMFIKLHDLEFGACKRPILEFLVLNKIWYLDTDRFIYLDCVKYS